MNEKSPKWMWWVTTILALTLAGICYAKVQYPEVIKITPTCDCEKE